MDELKKRTAKDFTAWDLNCPRVVKPKGGRKLKAVFKRKARRQMKRELRKKNNDTFYSI